MARRPLGRRKAAPPQLGSNLLFDMLTFPAFGIPRMLLWLAKEIAREAERERFDEGKVMAQLLELQVQHELREISDAEFSNQEAALLHRLSAMRQAKEAG